MKDLKNHQAEGQLLTAVSVGGVEALWRMAQRPGPVGQLARLALDEFTSPFSDFSPDEAVNLVIKKGLLT